MITLVLTTGLVISYLHFDTIEKCEEARAKLTEATDSVFVGVCIEGAKVEQEAKERKSDLSK